MGHSNYEEILLLCLHCHTNSHSTTPRPMNRARRWYTAVTLLYDLCYWPCHFNYQWEGCEQITFSLAKLMTIMQVAFTRDNARNPSLLLDCHRLFTM